MSRVFEIPLLSPRLEAVASLLQPCDRLYDIGTDHAFLPIHLFRRGYCKQATASDIRPGPIEAARRNISRAGLQNRIETAVAFGLDGYRISPRDAIVMAGLGGLEMIDILVQGPYPCQQIILQPQKSAMELRLWLHDHGYLITDETLVLDRGRLYVILVCRYEPELVQQSGEFSLLDAVVGPILLRFKPPLFDQHLHQLTQHLRKAIQGNPDLKPVFKTILDLQTASADNARRDVRDESHT